MVNQNWGCKKIPVKIPQNPGSVLEHWGKITKNHDV